MNTVQREPRSTGRGAVRAVSANSWTLRPMDWAKVWRKEPHPAEQASLTLMESMASPRIRRYFMSCPPMSMTLVTPGLRWAAAR